MKFLILYSFLLVSANIVSAQEASISDSAVAARLYHYSKTYFDDVLFVHTDKNVYTNNEQIWFSAYFVNYNAIATSQHSYLSVSLTKEDGRKVFLENKFIITKGICFGNLALPDSIPPGNYMFTAFSNMLDLHNRPVGIFTKQVTVKYVVNNGIKTKAFIHNSNKKNILLASVKVENENFQPINKAIITYSVNSGDFKKKTTNTEGLVDIQVEQKSEEQFIHFKVNAGDNFQLLSLKVPGLRKDSSIYAKFYPESGNLVMGLENKIGIETMFADGTPVSVKGILYKNNLPADTVYTTRYGIGAFKITPLVIDDFKMKIIWNSLQGCSDTSFFALPQAVPDAVTISMNTALTGDTAIFDIASSANRYLHVYVHNYSTLSATTKIYAGKESKRIKLLLQDVPRGLTTVTVTDAFGIPLAERIFFAHYYHTTSATLATGKQTYSRHEKVTVKLKLNNTEIKGLRAVVSVACVQSTRVNSANKSDIEIYFYLERFIDSLIPSLHFTKEYEPYLENLLLIKGWRRYTWQAAMSSIAEESPTYTVGITGTTIIDGKKPKKPVQIIIFRDSIIDLLFTDNTGKFKISPDNLLIMEGRRIFMSVNKNYNTEYEIKIADSLKSILDNLTSSFNFGIKLPATDNLEEKQLTEQEIPALKRLTEVVIRKKNSEADSYQKKGGANSNICGDYLCRYNILNCRNHYNESDNRPPQVGEQVYASGDAHFTNTKTVYEGCSIEKRQNIVQVPGIFYAREFYGVVQQQKDQNEPEYFSTIFWKSGILINTETDTELNFYTSDITGNFTVIVQGITENKDVLYKETMFMVTY